MSSQDSSDGQQCPLVVFGETGYQVSDEVITVTIGATVPTGFENTAAEEVQEKIGANAKISKDRGRIYFQITTDKLSQVHHLRSVDNLFVVVEEYDNYQFRDSKEETLEDLQKLASKLPWSNALNVWKMNTTLKKKRGPHRQPQGPRGRGRGKANKDTVETDTVQTETVEADTVETDTVETDTVKTDAIDTVETLTTQEEELELKAPTADQGEGAEGVRSPDLEILGEQQEVPGQELGAKVLKFRVTCSRAGDKHSFSSNEAARDFGGAVQELFQWKADMTKFDIEVLLNIHNVEVVIGIALTEESLHRRNITHFGPTTLRSTLCYGMLRLCKPQASDVILDPMCGTGAIPLEGAIEWQQAFYLAGDNNDMAVSRTVNNICHIQKKRRDKGSIPGLPIDTVQWDLCHLPMRTSSVDIIITDMPFGKRMGSRKNNWDLYPSCLREMARVTRPGSGKAVILTQDKKCFQKAISRMGGLWRKHHTVWVNVGGLHAGVFLLKRTLGIFGQIPEDSREGKELKPHEEKPGEERKKE